VAFAFLEINYLLHYEKGSEIIIIYEGNPFIYQVEEKKIGDLNNDGVVNEFDYGMMISRFEG